MNLKLLEPAPVYFGHPIRVLVDEEMNNAPWFVAVDTCKAIGVSTNHVTMGLRKLQEQDVCLNSIEGSRRKINLVNEPGFYELVLGSRKPGAVAFKRWVCAEVLPSIRRTGGYQAYTDDSNNPIDIPDVMVELVKTIPFDAHNAASRYTVREYVEIHGIEGIGHKQAIVIGTICRRHMLNNGLKIIRVWQPFKSNEVKKGGFGTYPGAILDLAISEYRNGLRS